MRGRSESVARRRSVGIVRALAIGAIALAAACAPPGPSLTDPITATPPATAPTAAPTLTPGSAPTAATTPTAAPHATPTAAPALPPPTTTAGPARPSPSPAATPSPASEAPSILSFAASPQIVDPGGEVTLSWEASAPSVTLCTTERGGPLGACREVEPTGSSTLTVPPSARGEAQYILFAGTGAQGEAYDQRSLRVEIRCPDEWFFDGPADDCPYPASLSAGAAQRFEHGLMIWHEGLDTIYVLYEDSAYPGRWSAHADVWEPSMPAYDPDIAPPSDLHQPVRGFGLVWRGTEGLVLPPRERLGWATGPEFPIETAFQCDSAPRYSTCYLLGPDGVVVLEPEMSGWHEWDSTDAR